ncbi:hypothetical protein BCR34DRAFT_566521 [Clohesyomyces aquaticus]|uniref:Uncharacterized protein n=1 Tax=Clohesyomyces aquaticus TaxID=1231657 RepID=A0A1Y1ZKE5_9PLEO|nr:hypothetical protein BCR34DRAFT_566521 [Clohesyomyces aquaticus]
MSSRDETVASFDDQPSDGQISPAARLLLERYSGISPDKVIQHIVAVRAKAWDIFPYPCIGQFRFLDLSLRQTLEYAEILQRLQEGQKLLDMACCFGQEIRQLVADGAPSRNLYGCDLREEFIGLGFELFRDADKLQATFLTADVFDPNSSLNGIRGQVDMIYTGSFFHLFDYDTQVQVSKVVASLLRPVSGAMISGRQVGSVNAGEDGHRTNPTGKVFRHNIDSFKKMWKDIGSDLGVDFAVEARLELLEHAHLRSHDSDTRRIWFVVRRQ